MTPKDQPVDEQYQTLTDICAENGGVTKPMADKLYAYFQAECNRARIEWAQSVRKEAYRKSRFELEAHAPGVLVDPNQIKWDVFEAELQQLMKEGER